MLCLTHPAAANQTFLVSDGEDVSTSDLLRRMGQAMGKPARLLPVRVPLGLDDGLARVVADESPRLRRDAPLCQTIYPQEFVV